MFDIKYVYIHIKHIYMYDLVGLDKRHLFYLIGNNTFTERKNRKK